MLLLSVPLEVVTWIVPEVALLGTVAFRNVSETTVNVAGVPLKVTLVVFARLFPKIPIVDPVLPAAGSASTNGPKPIDRLKKVPQPPRQADWLPPSLATP